MRQRTCGPYGWIEYSSLIAAHEKRARGSAVCIARARSDVKVAMPHWRGGLVETSATWSGLAAPGWGGMESARFVTCTAFPAVSAVTGNSLFRASWDEDRIAPKV